MGRRGEEREREGRGERGGEREEGREKKGEGRSCTKRKCEIL